MADAVRDLIGFHTKHKLLLLAHSPEKYRLLGRLVAIARPENVAHLALCYAVHFRVAMESSPTPGRHINVLQHISGYLRDHLSVDGRRALATAIHHYERGALPLAVPVRMVAVLAKLHQIRYLCSQEYITRYASDQSLAV